MRTFMADSLLDDAVSMGLNVIRIWAMIDIGGGRENIDGKKECNASKLQLFCAFN